MKKYGLKLLIIVLSSLFLLVGCVEEYKNTEVNATVIEKDYDKAKTTYRKVHGKTKKKTTPAEYDVELQYKDIVVEFDDKELYNKVKVGSKVKVIYKQGYDKNNELVYETLELID